MRLMIFQKKVRNEANMQNMIECRGIAMPHDERFINTKVHKRLSQDMYETPEVLGLEKFIKSSDRILELGAGLGFISSYLVKHLGVDHVTCVEANPQLCNYIERVHRANEIENASITNAVALSDSATWPKDDVMPFYVTDPFWSSSLSEPQNKPSTITHVAATRLSDMIKRENPSVIVCDIEGGEASLFDSVDLKGVRAIYMELHTRVYGGAGIRKVFDDMHRHNFFYHQKASCADVVLFERLKMH
ncbi:FkbM family methyltransferase [Roseovarius sp. D0-M9]|uniref:FkbM family methyltransferase n=1 Tax=Roseovarius sp. D0-M9 TaxID=3127117 RepID=UPI003010042A